jgi:hypothetical protein
MPDEETVRKTAPEEPVPEALLVKANMAIRIIRALTNGKLDDGEVEELAVVLTQASEDTLRKELARVTKS